jgi:hypothetical protein
MPKQLSLFTMSPLWPEPYSDSLIEIELGIRLVLRNLVKRRGEGRWTVHDQSKPGGIVVTGEGCECAIYAGGIKPCRHEWAARAPNACCLIGRIWRTRTIKDLRAVGEEFASLEPMHKDAPPEFVQIARHEYARRRRTLNGEKPNNARRTQNGQP